MAEKLKFFGPLSLLVLTLVLIPQALVGEVIKVEEHSFEVTSQFGDRDVFQFTISQPGTITAEATWRGNAPKLALILNGPTPRESARRDGKSPLTVSFNVTQEVLKKGTNWKVSIVNFSRRGSAKGTIKISYPSREVTTKPSKVTPEVKPIIILGNGDSRQKFQTFKLPKVPLAYPNSAGETPPEVPELQIYVNSRLWTRVPSFFGRGPEEEIYIVRQDENGNMSVQFGDGMTGRRLPSGTNNVVAKYRTGTGAPGALKIKRLQPQKILKPSPPQRLRTASLVKTEEHPFKVSSKFGDRDVFEFRVNAAGTISVKASWTGDAPQLALILNGPTPRESARRDGKSPLTVSFNVTQEVLKKGTNWKVSIVNFSRRGSAKGTIKISYPSREVTTKPPKVIPKVKPLITKPAVMPKLLPLNPLLTQLRFQKEIQEQIIPKITNAGITDARELLKRTSTLEGFNELSEETGIENDRLLKIALRAELRSILDESVISDSDLGLLESAGMASIPSFSRFNLKNKYTLDAIYENLKLNAIAMGYKKDGKDIPDKMKIETIIRKAKGSSSRFIFDDERGSITFLDGMTLPIEPPGTQDIRALQQLKYKNMIAPSITLEEPEIPNQFTLEPFESKSIYKDFPSQGIYPLRIEVNPKSVPASSIFLQHHWDVVVHPYIYFNIYRAPATNQEIEFTHQGWNQGWQEEVTIDYTWEEPILPEGVPQGRLTLKPYGIKYYRFNVNDPEGRVKIKIESHDSTEVFYAIDTPLSDTLYSPQRYHGSLAGDSLELDIPAKEITDEGRVINRTGTWNILIGNLVEEVEDWYPETPWGLAASPPDSIPLPPPPSSNFTASVSYPQLWILPDANLSIEVDVGNIFYIATLQKIIFSHDSDPDSWGFVNNGEMFVTISSSVSGSDDSRKLSQHFPAMNWIQVSDNDSNNHPLEYSNIPIFAMEKKKLFEDYSILGITLHAYEDDNDYVYWLNPRTWFEIVGNFIVGIYGLITGNVSAVCNLLEAGGQLGQQITGSADDDMGTAHYVANKNENFGFSEYLEIEGAPGGNEYTDFFDRVNQIEEFCSRVGGAFPGDALSIKSIIKDNSSPPKWVKGDINFFVTSVPPVEEIKVKLKSIEITSDRDGFGLGSGEVYINTYTGSIGGIASQNNYSLPQDDLAYTPFSAVDLHRFPSSGTHSMGSGSKWDINQIIFDRRFDSSNPNTAAVYVEIGVWEEDDVFDDDMIAIESTTHEISGLINQVWYTSFRTGEMRESSGWKIWEFKQFVVGRKFINNQGEEFVFLEGGTPMGAEIEYEVWVKPKR